MRFLEQETTITMPNKQWFVVAAALSTVLKNGLEARRSGFPRTVIEDDIKAVEQVLARAMNTPTTEEGKAS